MARQIMFAFVVLFVSAVPVRSDTVAVRAFTGDDVTLQCSAPNARLSDRSGVYWTRDDLVPPRYVMFYKNGHLDSEHQEPSYGNRAHVAHPQLENNDLSLVIKNLSLNDSGTYACKLLQGGAADGDLFGGEPIRTIELTVTEPEGEGPDSAGRALVVALSVTGAVIVAVVVAAVALGVGLFLGVRRLNTRRSETDTEMSDIP